MKFAVVALAAALWVPAAAAQATHHHPEPKKPQAQRPAPAPAEPRAPAARGGGTFRSAFEDYRPFPPDEPLKDWRAANEEVKEAGGHVGLMKGREKK